VEEKGDTSLEEMILLLCKSQGTWLRTVCSIVTTSCVGVLKASTLIQNIQTKLDNWYKYGGGCYCIMCIGYGLSSSNIWFWQCQDCYKDSTISGYKGQGTDLCWLSIKLFWFLRWQWIYWDWCNKRDGVLLGFVMDGSREQTMSEFRRKVKDG